MEEQGLELASLRSALEVERRARESLRQELETFDAQLSSLSLTAITALSMPAHTASDSAGQYWVRGQVTGWGGVD